MPLSFSVPARLAVALAAALLSLQTAPASAQAPAGTAAPATAAAQVRGLPDFTDLVDAVGPAVVNIRTLQRAKPDSGDEMSDEQRELFRRFFGVPPPQGTPRQGPRRGQPSPGEGPEVPRGVGSGFIVSADGYVLTNAHVVDGADEVIVRLTDKREFKARIVGADKRSDVAVVKIEADKLPFVRFGDVSRLKAGEWVIAIGSPFDLDNTVTAGIVSAKSRDTGELVPLIQTDVAINPGNSGGPLINLRGEVVGINSQIYSRSGGYMGISFAIPADEAQRIAAQLRATGRVVRGRIGVRIGEVTKDVAESLGLPKPAGALVRATEDGGPGAKAGIEAGDIITRFDQLVIEKWTDLPRFVGNTPPGSQHKVEVWRKGALKELPVTVAELEPDTATAKADAPKPEAPPTGHAASLGLQVADIPEADKREAKLKNGVLITAVSGLAARADLRPGDVLLGVANTDITSAKQLDAVLARVNAQQPAKPFSVLFKRDEFVQYAVIRPGK
jgi:serine protease Do